VEKWNLRPGQGLRGNVVEYLYWNLKPERATRGVEDDLFFVLRGTLSTNEL
jgi:hypothetical protein